MSMVKGQKNEWFLNNLQENSEYLKLLDDEFLRTRDNHLFPRGCEIVSFYELKDSPIVKVRRIQLGSLQALPRPSNRKQKVSGGKYERDPECLIRMVGEHSATASTPKQQRSNIRGISCDHSHLVKFRSKTDKNFQDVTFKLQALLENMGMYAPTGNTYRVNSSPVPVAVVLAVRAFYSTELQISQFDKTKVLSLRLASTQFKSHILHIFSRKECSKGIKSLLDEPYAEQWQNIPETETSYNSTLPDNLQGILTELRDHVKRYGDLAVSASTQGIPLRLRTSRPSYTEVAHKVVWNLS